MFHVCLIILCHQKHKIPVDAIPCLKQWLFDENKSTLATEWHKAAGNRFGQLAWLGMQLYGMVYVMERGGWAYLCIWIGNGVNTNIYMNVCVYVYNCLYCRRFWFNYECHYLLEPHRVDEYVKLRWPQGMVPLNNKG